MIRYVRPVSRGSASGVTARVYEGMAREFGVHAEPITLHSPVPELVAGAWSLCREHLVAGGRVDRALKETVAATVSNLNRCPFCVDAHAVMLAATGHSSAAIRLEHGERERLGDPALERGVEWAAATRSPGAAALADPPFDAGEAPEMIGTAVLFHYINRPVSVFLGDSPLPLGGRLLKGAMLRVGGRRFRTFTRARPAPGESLDFLPEAPLPDDLAWASGSPVLAGAWARFAAATERAGERSLPAQVRARLRERLREWRGGDPGLGVEWLERDVEGLDDAHLPAARLALLVAFAPYRVDEQVVEAFRDAGAGTDGTASDARLVGAVSWAALAAARRIGSWLAVGEPALSR
jgi:AhpD family alkylhydroperoxidase